jgi:hypothetical protein
MQTNIPIQTVLIHKLRSISKPIIRLAKETGCAPEILLSYHTILSQRPQLEQSISYSSFYSFLNYVFSVLADTFAILIVACYFGEYQFLLIATDKVRFDALYLQRAFCFFIEGYSISMANYSW